MALNESTLEYFDKAGDAPGTGKAFELTGSSLTSYTSTENCMCISNSADKSDDKSWFLLAENERYCFFFELLYIVLLTVLQ